MDSNQPARNDTDIIGKRAIAQVIDLVLMGVVFFALWMAFAFTGGFIVGLTGTGGSGIIDTFSGIGVLIGVIGTIGYSFILEALWDGQTIGKRLVGIRVVTEGGERITTSKALLRNIPAVASFGWIPYIVALISMAATDRRQRLFDTLAGTVVVREEYTLDQRSADPVEPESTNEHTID